LAVATLDRWEVLRPIAARHEHNLDPVEPRT